MQPTRNFLALFLMCLFVPTLLVSCGGGEASGNFGDDDEFSEEPQSVFTFQGIATPNPQNNFLTQYGVSADISKDGSLLVVGAPSNSLITCPEGSEIELELDEEADTLCEIEIGEDPEDSTQIIQITLPADELNLNSGAVFVYERVDTSQPFSALPTAVLVAPSRDENDFFGWAVSVSDDGSIVAVSAVLESGDSTSDIYENAEAVVDETNNDAFQAGAAYVFNRDPGGWAEYSPLDVVDLPQYIKADNAESGDRFGWALTIAGDGSYLAVSAPQEGSGSNADGANNAASCAGAVYIYANDGSGNFLNEVYLKPNNPSAMDVFGQSLSFTEDGTKLAVGASQFPSTRFLEGCYGGVSPLVEDVIDQMAPGKVHVFEQNGPDWQSSVEQVLVANVRDNGDSFGHSVSINQDGSRVAVGARYESSSSQGINGDPGNDVLGTASGAAYLFELNGTRWVQTQYFKASNSGVLNLFGSSVRLTSAGTGMAVGAVGKCVVSGGVGGGNGDLKRCAIPSGAAYLFKETSGDWGEVAYIKPNSLAAGATFGYDIEFAEDNENIVITAPGFIGSVPGTIYLYDF